jgi:hypothetical protein
MMPRGQVLSHNFTWLKREVEASTVDEQRRYALPDGGGTPLRFKAEISCEMKDVNNYAQQLTHKLKRDIENDPTYKDTTDAGTPKVYCIDDFDLWLYPLPDHSMNSDTAWTLNLEYYGYLASLSGDTDSNYLTDNFPEVLEYGATELGYRHGLDSQQADFWSDKKVDLLIGMIKEDQQVEFAGLESGMQPRAGFGLGEGKPAMTDGFYRQRTHYE